MVGISDKLNFQKVDFVKGKMDSVKEMLIFRGPKIKKIPPGGGPLNKNFESMGFFFWSHQNPS